MGALGARGNDAAPHSLTRDQSDGPSQTDKEVGR